MKALRRALENKNELIERRLDGTRDLDGILVRRRGLSGALLLMLLRHKNDCIARFPCAVVRKSKISFRQ